MQFKLNIVGCISVGKSTLVSRYLSMESEEVELKFSTTSGNITFHVVMSEVPLDGCDGYIFMFSVVDIHSYGLLYQYVGTITKPKVICGNKVDLDNRVIKVKDIQIHKHFNCKYYEVSAKAGYNCDNLFLYIMRELTNDAELHLVHH